jgi:ankyrin repeat protein
MSREKNKKKIMNFRKFHNLLIGGCIFALAMSCTGTKKTTVTQKASETSTVENTIDIEETEPIATPSKVRPQIDPTLAANNLDEINKYIDDLKMWTYVERVIAPYETIDEAINQDSIKIFHRVIASYNSINNASKEDANRLNQVIKFLLQKKADVNLLNDDGEDALAAFLKIGSNSSRTLDAYNRDRKHHSAEELEPMVKLFIENGADIKSKDTSGVSTFERIVDFAGMDFIKTLLDNDIEINYAFSAAVRHNHIELINYLLDKGAVLNTSTDEGKDAFMHAAANIDDLELFKRIVDKTSDINVETVTNNQQRRNALSYMIYIGEDRKYKSQLYFTKKLVYLLDKGIKINEKDWDKPNEENSLIVQTLKSFKYEDADIICKKLIENGANVNLIHFRRTPLYYLISNKIYYDSESLLLLLIEKGSDVNFVNREKTPLDLMTTVLESDKEDVRNRKMKYAEILKSNGAKTFNEL